MYAGWRPTDQRSPLFGSSNASYAWRRILLGRWHGDTFEDLLAGQSVDVDGAINTRVLSMFDVSIVKVQYKTPK
jgi:hypothetical protein